MCRKQSFIFIWPENKDNITMKIIKNPNKNPNSFSSHAHIFITSILGSSVMKNYTPSMIQLWTSAFPALGKDVEKEKERGNLRTWQLTFENRDGALCCMFHLKILLFHYAFECVKITLQNCL